MSQEMQPMFIDGNSGRRTIVPKVDVNCKRPRSHSSHSARSTGSSGSSGSYVESSLTSGSPPGNLSPTPPSIGASEEDMDFYFGFESPKPAMNSNNPHHQFSYAAAVPMHVDPYAAAGYANYPSTATARGYPPMIPAVPYAATVPPRHISAGGFAHPHQPQYVYHPQYQQTYPFGMMGGSPNTGSPHHHQTQPRRFKRTPSASSSSSSTVSAAGTSHHHHHPHHHHVKKAVVVPQPTPAAAAQVQQQQQQQQQGGQAFQREGSLRLQELIPSASTEQRQAILNDLVGELPQLSRTPYGNYVVQKLIQHGTPQQRLTIVQVLKHHFETLATDLYGHRVVSKALEYGDDTCKSIILGSLLSCFKDMVNDEHGNYVAQKCIKTLATYQCEAIWEKFFGRVWITATHKFGHCVLKTLFLYAPTEVKDRILNEMSKNVILLAKDPYGNYVLQHILDKEQYGDLLPRHNIIGSLLEQFDDLSCNKFASNVVEKCLRCTDAAMLDVIVYRFCATSNKKLGKLINNPFGNYVVKTLMALCDGKQKERIRSRCVRIYQRIRCSCAVPAIFGECRMELERRFRERRPDICDDDEDEDDDEEDDEIDYNSKTTTSKMM